MFPRPSTSGRVFHTNLSALTSLLVLLLVLLVSLSSVEGRRGEKEKEKERKEELKKLLEKMLKAVELESEFFASDYSGINLDGLFGIRVGQGQIVEAVRECKSSASCPVEIQRRLEALNDQIDVTSSTALGYVQSKDPEYLQQFLPTVNKPYIIRYVPVTWTDTEQLAHGKVGADHGYSESAGDACFARIFGTYIEDGKAIPPCNVTESCWSMMIKTNTAGYSITHQLLYFILNEKTNCTKEVEQSMQSDVRATEESFCRKIYTESAQEVKDGSVPERYQDLFLEQVVLCAVLGFESFQRPDWMKMVLTWQTPSGCFTSDTYIEAAKDSEQTKPRLNEEEKSLMKDLMLEAQMIERQRQGRKLLRESVMSGDCLSHKSGLAFGTLSVHTRYLLRQLYLDQ